MTQNRKHAYTLARIVVLVILLAFVCLAWYGAEMLLYDYSQPSIVKGIVAVALAIIISGNMQKGAILNERREQLAKGIVGEFSKDKEKKDGKD